MSFSTPILMVAACARALRATTNGKATPAARTRRRLIMVVPLPIAFLQIWPAACARDEPSPRHSAIGELLDSARDARFGLRVAEVPSDRAHAKGAQLRTLIRTGGRSGIAWSGV